VTIPDLKLNDGNTISQVGLGVWQVKDQAELNAAFNSAIEAGYRHVDTAQAYENEQFLGEAWSKSGLKREELFITTKIKVTHFGRRHLKPSFEESLQNLKTDYIDLLLLHFPVTFLRKNAWLELEEIQAAGQAKSIGVSNYTIRHLEEMKDYAKIVPAVNQVELHLFLQQPELIKYCKEHNIVVEAYSPLAHASKMDDPVIVGIAKKHGKTYAQVMLRWLVEQDLVILPKSVTPSRIGENIGIFDFRLNDEDLAKLSKLNRNMRTCWNPAHIP
jgi:diketogulonate reductase-like aldo/keto reductase